MGFFTLKVKLNKPEQLNSSPDSLIFLPTCVQYNETKINLYQENRDVCNFT